MDLEAAIDGSLKPAFLVDAFGALRHANGPGYKSLRREESLRLKDGCVRPVNAVHDQQFSRILWSVTVQNGTEIRRGALRLFDRKGSSTVLFVHAVSDRSAERPSDGSRAVLILSAQLRDAEIDAIRLRVTFGFTTAEDRLVRDLIRGKSLSEIGEKHRLGRETLKSQLSSLFRKTGTHRQGELVALLLSSLSDSSA